MGDLRRLEAEGQPGLVLEVTTLFSSQVERLLRALGDAATAGDGAAWQSRLHALRGTAGSVGAMRLSARCEELERCPAPRSHAEAAAGLADLELAFREAREALGSEESSLARPA